MKNDITMQNNINKIKYNFNVIDQMMCQLSNNMLLPSMVKLNEVWLQYKEK